MKKILILLLLYTLPLFPEKKQTVCLNMIVKDESHVIERCLESVKPLIDYWVIVDTGSSDGTEKLIKKCMKKIPGKLYKRPWKNFEHNRNEALQLAKNKGDYLLFIDADEELILEQDFSLPELDKELYTFTVDYSGTNYERTQLVKTSVDWEWKGVLHEVLVTDEPFQKEKLSGITNMIRHEGARSKDPTTFVKDSKILKEALKQDPHSTRYCFYLAQSYRDARMYEKSLKYYKKRIEMGGWDEEIFWSKYQIGLLSELMEKPTDEIIEAYTAAYSYRPTRAEPLYRIASCARRSGNYLLGYLAATKGYTIPKPSVEVLFLEDWIYQYGLLLEKSISSYWIGKFDESLRDSLSILNQKNLPENVRDCVEKNQDWALKMLRENPKSNFSSELALKP